ncbi:MAG: asparagine synthase-related protein, partial [Candidatus Methylomirabilis sp.]
MKTPPDETRLKLERQTALNGWVASFERGSNLAGGGSRLRLLYGTEEALPTVSTAGSCAAIFEGVLFDRDLLRKNLGDRVDPTWNEARLVIEAYRRWGEGVLHKIRGIFALILWDKALNILVCARDPLGIHPVYYAERGRELLVSSSLASLLQSPNVPRELNRAALADQLCHRFPVPDETYFAGIRRIMAGHALRESGSGCHVYRYWSPVPTDGPAEWIREDALDRFDQVLEQAVARCLSVGPAGFYLSGGLDSVSAAAVAAAVARRDNLPVPLALSLAFPHPDCNEEAVQTGVASGLGMPQVMIPFHEAAGPEGLLWAAVEMSKSLSTPTLNPWRAAYFTLGQAAFQRGCRVIMTGNGGDECLTVSPRYGADLIRSFNLRGFYRLGTSFLRSYHLPRLHHIRFILWKAGIRPVLELYGAKIMRSVAPDRLGARRHTRLASSTQPWIAPNETLRKELDQRIE